MNITENALSYSKKSLIVQHLFSCVFFFSNTGIFFIRQHWKSFFFKIFFIHHWKKITLWTLSYLQVLHYGKIPVDRLISFIFLIFCQVPSPKAWLSSVFIEIPPRACIVGRSLPLGTVAHVIGWQAVMGIIILPPVFGAWAGTVNSWWSTAWCTRWDHFPAWGHETDFGCPVATP